MKKIILGLSLLVAIHTASALDTKPATFESETVYSISPGLTFLSGVVGPSINTYLGLAPFGGDEFYIGVDAGAAFFFPGSLKPKRVLMLACCESTKQLIQQVRPYH
jgi:hypothetical protein